MVYHVPVDLYNIQRGNEVEKQRFSSVQNEILKNKLFTVLAFTGKTDDGTTFYMSFFIYFSDMHLHAYSKASYQTHTNTLCHLHKLQIMSGTSVQN